MMCKSVAGHPALRISFLAVSLLVSTANAVAAPAPGSSGAAIIVAPTRLVLENRDRSATVMVKNSGFERGTFRLSLVAIDMDRAGRLTPSAEPSPAAQMAASLVRLSPRQFVLEPRGTQQVRVVLRKPAALPAGEYRTHLRIEAIPDSRPAKGRTASTKLSIGLTVQPAAVIPVIVRHGELAAKVAVNGVRLERTAAKRKNPNDKTATPGGLAILLNIQRTGNRSVYGDVVVQFFPGSSAAGIQVGRVGGVAVYLPIEEREVRLVVPEAVATKLHGGRLRVTYSLPVEQGGTLLAETTVAVP